MRTILIITLILALAACAGRQERRAIMIAEKCEAYGLQRGTIAYMECAQREEALMIQRDAAAATAFGAVMGAQRNAVLHQGLNRY